MFGSASRSKSSSQSPSKRPRAASPAANDDICYQDDARTCYDDVDWVSDARGRCRALDFDAALGCCPSRDLDDSGVEETDDSDMKRGRPRKRIRISYVNVWTLNLTATHLNYTSMSMFWST
jgi:hypothetical protein